MWDFIHKILDLEPYIVPRGRGKVSSTAKLSLVHVVSGSRDGTVTRLRLVLVAASPSISIYDPYQTEYSEQRFQSDNFSELHN